MNWKHACMVFKLFLPYKKNRLGDLCFALFKTHLFHYHRNSICSLFSAAHIPTPMEISSSVAQVIPGSIDIYNSVAGSDVVTTTQTIASVNGSVVEGDEVTDNSVVVSASMVPSEANIVSADGTITTSLDQWLTTVNQVCYRHKRQFFFLCIYCRVYLYLELRPSSADSHKGQLRV